MRERLLAALGTFFRPICRMMIRAGISYHEVTEVLRSAFVSVAVDDFAQQNRSLNSSRIAAITGISRREVSRLKQVLVQSDRGSRDRMHSPSMLLHEWAMNSDYRNPHGDPAMIPMFGEGPSFEALVKIAGRGVTTNAMLQELQRVGCVEVTDENLVKMMRSDFFDTDLTGRLSVALSNQLRMHAETILHNTDPKKQNIRYRERIAYTNRLDQRDTEAFRRLIEARIDSIDSDTNAAIDNYECLSDRSVTGDAFTAGLGVYYFQRLD